MSVVQPPVFKLKCFVGLIAWSSIAQVLPAQAQVIPDNSLGSENSVVTPRLDIRGRPGEQIDGGAIRGENLFHSFQEFNVREGRGVYFSNPDNIINILTRVTGNNASQILGTLGVLGDANLFLINPNGIVFGPNARLDVGGSFFAATADGIVFENGLEFSASNPQAPPLLAINMPLGLNIRENAGSLVNQSRAINENNLVGLQVPEGETLGFVGNEIRFEGGQAVAPGGRLELGSIQQGRVNIQTETSGETGESFRLQIPPEALRSDVIFTESAIANVTGNDGGSIVINARNVEFQESGLFAGIRAGSGSPDSQAGDIEINAGGDVNLSQSSVIFNDVESNATGAGGNIRIAGRNLSVRGNSVLSASTFGEGSAGNIAIDAENQVSFDGFATVYNRVEEGAQGRGGDIRVTAGQVSVTNEAIITGSTAGRGNAGNVIVEADQVSVAGNSGIFSQVLETGEGLGGNIRVNTRTLSVSEGGILASNTFGRGDAGNVQVNGTQTVSLSGNSSISSSVGSGAVGNGGNVEINTGSLSVSGGSSLQATVSSIETAPENSGIIQGNAGSIRVNADTKVSFGGAGSGAFSTLEPGASGNAGSIEINAGSIFVTDGAELSSSTSGFGNAGNVRLNARNFVSLNDPGSGVFSTVEPGATGNSGTVTINTDGSLQVTNGARVESAIKADPAFGFLASVGNAGDVRINAGNQVLFDGPGTTASSALETGGSGTGGSIEINTGSLAVRNGAQLQAQTQGFGDAGDIIINAPEGTVTFAGSSEDGVFPSAAFSTVEAGANGEGGNIRINAGNLSLSNGGQLQTVTRGFGNAGRIEIDVRDRVIVEGSTDQLQSGAFSTVEAGAAGDSRGITITAGTVEVKDGATLQALIRGSADPFGGIPAGQGNAGDIQINARDRVSVEGDLSRIASSLGLGAIGSGGNIEINTGDLSVGDGGQLQAQTEGFGNAGNITINAPNGPVSFSGTGSDGSPSGAFSTVGFGAVGEGGNLSIAAGSLSVSGGGQLQAQTQGFGNAGNITINAPNGSVSFSGTASNGSPSGAYSSVEAGAFGDSRGITITAGTLELKDGGTLQTLIRGTFNSFGELIAGQGNAGDIQINAAQQVSVDGDFSRIVSGLGTGAIGSGGNIEINTGNLSVTNGGQLQAQTQGIGDAGNVTINAGGRVLFEGVDSQGFSSAAFSTVEPGGIGNSGDITIRADSLEVRDGGRLESLVRGDAFGFFSAIPREGNAGNIRIEVSGNTSFDGSFSGAFSQIESGIVGEGGNIEITTGNLSVTNGAQLQAQMEGFGEGGDIIINAQDGIIFDGVDNNNQPSRAITVVATLAEGNGGSINISGRNLSVTNGGQLDASVNQGGLGNAGNIIVNVRENVRFDGAENSAVARTGAFTTVEQQAFGFAGEINITAENLAVLNGAQLQALTRGFGGTGDIILNANNAFFGQTREGNFGASGVFSTVESGALSFELFGEGNSGNVEISADNIFITDRAQIQTRTASIGDAGNILISTANLSITNQGELQAQTQGIGDAGDIFVSALNNISIDDSRMFTDVGILEVNAELLSAFGEGGDININTNNLFLANGGQLQAQSQGFGNAGNIKLNARESVVLDGVSTDEFPSAAFTAVGFLGLGDGGDIHIIADNLAVINGANLRAETNGQGNAGNVIIDANNSVFFDGTLETADRVFNSFGASFVNLYGVGEGGDVRINTRILFVTGGAQLDASTFGSGNAGNVIINARENISLDNSAVFTNVGITGVGDGGNVEIKTGNLTATQNSELQAQTQGFGNAGNVIIQAEGDVLLDGSSRIFATVEPTANLNSQGGEIRITADNFSVMNGSQLQTLTRGSGDAGTITIETRDSVIFDGTNSQLSPSSAASTVELGAVGEGGEIFITADNLSISNGGEVTTSTLGQGDGGSITINTNELSLLNNAEISASNEGTFQNRGGSIEIETGDAILNNISRLFTVTNSGDGGNIELEGRDIFLRNGSLIRTDAGLENLEGDGGNLRIDNELLVGLERSQIAANAFFGRGGEINIRALGLFGFQVLGRQSLEEQFGTGGLVDFDPTVLSRSSITSISRTDPSLSGIVLLNTEIDPDAALVDLPQNVVDPADLINQDPCKQGQDSEFYIKGRGGIAPNPAQDPSAIPSLIEVEPSLIEPVSPQRNNTPESRPDRTQKRDNNPENIAVDSRTIVPARGWIRNEKGEVILVGYDPAQTGVTRPQPNPNVCQP